MYELPESYISAATAKGRKIALRVDLGEVRNGSYVDKASYKGGKGVFSLKIVRGQTTGGFSLGGTVCATLTATFSNDVEINVKDRIQVYVGFGAPESVPKWQGLGWFYVDSVKKGMDNQSVTACDAMLRFAKNYKSKLTYPAKVSDILGEISGQTKIHLSDGLELFNDVQIEKTPEKGEDKDGNKQYYTRREILGYLGGINGGSAYIDVDFKINFAVPKETGYTISWKNTTSQSVDDTDFSVSHIVWNRSGITHSLGDDFEENTVEFTDPLAYTSSELILHNLETNIIGLSYNSITIKKQGTGMFQLGDLVDYEALDGKTYKMLIMGIVYDFSGGFFSETLYSLAKSASQQEYAGNQVIDQTEHIKETAGTGGVGTLTSYDILSDSSVKLNGVTYTVEKNETGLISKISDSGGNELKPEISGEITDTALHNSVFWAVAMARGIGRSAGLGLVMPDMSGITGYFIPETRAISEKQWRNHISGGNSITFTGASENGHAVHLDKTNYGSYSTLEPNTVYCIFKCSLWIMSSGILWQPVITKNVTKDNLYYGFDLFSCIKAYSDYGEAAFSAIDSDLVSDTSTTSYVVGAYSRSGSATRFFVNASEVLKSSDTSAATAPVTARSGNYGGKMLLNTTARSNSVPSNNIVGEVDIIMCAFGTAYHTEEQIISNSRWLMKKLYEDWND